jgi:hypothetical protein
VVPVSPDGIEGEVYGDLTVVSALQHVAGLQAVQEPLHQGYAPATTPTYNRTIESPTTELQSHLQQNYRVTYNRTTEPPTTELQSHLQQNYRATYNRTT